MRMKRKAVSVVAGLLAMCTVAMTGCQAKHQPADQIVSALYEMGVKDNPAPITELLGFESEDAARESLMSTGTATMMDQFVEQLGGVEFDEQELQEMEASMKTMMDKLVCTAEITENGVKEKTVVLKVKSFSAADMGQLMADIQNELSANMDQETAMAIASGDMEVTNKVNREVIKNFIARLSELEPKEEETEITVKCEKLRVNVNGKDKVAWMPSDMTKFSTDAEASIFK